MLLQAGCPGVQICVAQAFVVESQYVPAKHGMYRVLDSPSAEQRSTWFPLQKYVFAAQNCAAHVPLPTQNKPERLQSLAKRTVNPSAEHWMANVFWHSEAPGVHTHGLHWAAPPATTHVCCVLHADGDPRVLPFGLHVAIALFVQYWLPAVQLSGAHIP